MNTVVWKVVPQCEDMKFIVPTEEDSKRSQQDILKLKTQEGHAFRLSNANEFLRSSGYTLLLLNST